jgi:hypothetical protein
MKFTLPISPEYISHWGLWEAVREIYQNALDEQTRDSSCKASLEYMDGIVRIATSKGTLSPESLVLGKTSKRDDPFQRGKFGEGYKLALLVLARLGHGVEILTGNERWDPRLEHDSTFNSPVLNIYTEPRDLREGVEFIITGIEPEQWGSIQKNIRPIEKYAYSTVLEEPEERGRIYVGGLYVSTEKEFRCGYSFTPNKIKLDRDRGMVNGFDLAWETSNLWTARGSNRAVELLNEEAPDVQYVESHAQKHSPLVLHQADHFHAKHGYDAVPVSDQEEIEQATRAGIKWVLVPETVKSVLRLVKSWFIPTTESPAERLCKFRDKYRNRMNAEMKHDLDEIIQAFDSRKEMPA